MLDTYSERIKYAMNLRNISQTELVKRTGLNKGAISSYLNDKYNPKQDAIYLLAKALNVSEIWLMGLSEDINRTNVTNKSSSFGSEEEIYNYLVKQGREDLWHTFQAVNSSDSLRILMDGAADLSPEDLEPVLILVQGIRKSKGME